MDMNKLDALAVAARDLLREHAYMESVTVTAVKGERGLAAVVDVLNIDGTVSRIVHAGEAPF